MLSGSISSPSTVRKLGALSGPGATLMINSIRRFAPISRLPEAQKTGKRVKNYKVGDLVLRPGLCNNDKYTVGCNGASLYIYDHNGNKKKGYGGGNCQVSTTIYNAVLTVEGIDVTERHPHNKKVTYIEEGKDAAVSYSSGLDLKFTNNTGNDIKIYASSDNDSVDVRIVEIR